MHTYILIGIFFFLFLSDSNGICICGIKPHLGMRQKIFARIFELTNNQTLNKHPIQVYVVKLDHKLDFEYV